MKGIYVGEFLKILLAAHGALSQDNSAQGQRVFGACAAC
jgi:hypothetical protein